MVFGGLGASFAAPLRPGAVPPSVEGRRASSGNRATSWKVEECIDRTVQVGSTLRPRVSTLAIFHNSHAAGAGRKRGVQEDSNASVRDE